MATPIQIHQHGLPWEEDFGYAQVLVAGDTAYVSGQFAHDAEGNAVGEGDFEAQATCTFENLDKVLTKIGATRNQVVHTGVMVVDLDKNCTAVTAAHKKFFGAHRPASTTWGVKALYLPYMLLEINLIVRLDIPK